MYGLSYFGRSRPESEPDYMNVLKPHFNLDNLSNTTEHNALLAIKRAKLATDMDDDPIDYDLAPGLATQATLLTENNTLKDSIATYDEDPTICVECGDESVYICHDCIDSFCHACFHLNHRRGKRQLHKFLNRIENIEYSNNIDSTTTTTTVSDSIEKDESTASGDTKSGVLSSIKNFFSGTTTTASSFDHHSKSKALQFDDYLGEWWEGKTLHSEWFVERAKYIPLRLTHEERKFLRLLEGVLKICGYTDKVDTVTFKSKKDRIRKMGQEAVSIYLALIGHTDIQKARELTETGNFAQYQDYLKNIFEVGRRHKIRNPEKMRTTYNMMLYFLQDMQSPEMQDFFGFTLDQPIRTVYSLLESVDAVDVLRDPLLAVATQVIIPDGKSQHQVQSISDRKYKALKALTEKYCTRGAKLSKETLRLAVFSIGDNHHYLQTNRDPCNTMLTYLQTYFKPNTYTSVLDNLGITEGEAGARLTHSHETQYAYVLQSLCLWRDILDDFFRLWCLAEQDILDTANNPYKLCETGQGIHRLQQAPRIDKAMRNIIYKVHLKQNNWVGSSVIHLGDRNVPNALFFIDKYNQVGKSLHPICIVLRNIPKLLDRYATKNAETPKKVENYLFIHYRKDYKLAQQVILRDIFRYAFDGSGSDSFFEAGSCLDARLNRLGGTLLEMLTNQPYFPLFRMCDFVGFDGTEWD